MITQIEGPKDFFYDMNRDRIKKLFDLTPKQMKEIEKATSVAGEAVQELCNPADIDAKQEKMTREQQLEVDKKYREIEKEFNEKILKIFTPKQHEKLDQLNGKKIDVEKATEEMEKAASS
jgi:Spy/CpxP family protein refolding chaperone